MIKSFVIIIIVGNERGKKNKDDRDMRGVDVIGIEKMEIIVEMNDFILIIKNVGVKIGVVWVCMRNYVIEKMLGFGILMMSMIERGLVIVKMMIECCCIVNW